MVYDHTQMKEKPLPKAGTQEHGKVTVVEEGTLADFIDKEVLKKWEGSDKDDKALKVTFESDNIKKDKVMTLPKTDEGVSPRSIMGKWKKAYGDYPHVGQEIFLTADADGYYQFAC